MKSLWSRLFGSGTDDPVGKRDIPRLIRALGSKGYEPALAALTQIGQDAVGPLIETLRNRREGWLRRKNAAVALGSLQAPGAVDHLLWALDDADGNVQEGAAWALGLMQERRAFDRLSALMLRAPLLYTRAIACAALAKVDDHRAPVALVSLLKEVALFRERLDRGDIPAELAGDSTRIRAKWARMDSMGLFDRARDEPPGSEEMIDELRHELSRFMEHIVAQGFRPLAQQSMQPLAKAATEANAYVQKAADWALKKITAGDPPSSTDPAS